MNIADVTLILTTALAAVFDVRTRRIPNAIPACAAIAAIAIHVPAGPVAVFAAISVIVVAFLIGCLAFALGWFGGGDVKLLAAACGIAGLSGALSLVLDVLVTGAFLAIGTALLQGRLFALLRSTAFAARGGTRASFTLPYAVAIAAGAVIYALSPIVPALRLPL